MTSMLEETNLLTQIDNDFKKDLFLFYYRYVACDFRERLDAPHIDLLASKLMDLKKGDIKRLCVAMPPRHSKSSMITLAYPLWLLKDDKSLNILIVNNSAGLSEKFGIQLREYVKRIGPEFDLYLSDVKHSSTYLMFTNSQGELYSGSIRLVGASGSITGQDADYIILDDIYSGFDDITPTLLEKKIEWFQTIIEQRIEPHTRLMILHTRWHSNDLQGYLKENYPEDYTFIEFPAIATENDVLGREPGGPLWPQRYTLTDYDKKRKAMGERQFQAIYQQQPIDLQGDFFDLDYLQYNKQPTNITGTLRAYDIAYSESGDYTVGILGYKDDEDNFYIQDMVRGQFGNRNKKIVQETAEHDGQDTPIAIEYGVGAAAKLIANEWSNTLTNYTIKEIVPINAKEDRAFPLSNAIIDGKVICNLKGKAREDFLREFISFPDGGHDDIVDATAHCYNMLFRTSKKNITAAIIDL